MRYLSVEGTGLSATQVDAILIAASGIGTWTGEKSVQVANNNAAPTSAADATIATLQGYGVTVITN